MSSAEAAASAEQPARLGANYYKLYAATALSNIGDGMSGIAYPWLATAITRNPVLVASVAAAQRLPWLVFTLPAGVITDRVDRRKAIVAMDSLRFLFTMVVAFAVLVEQDTLPAPDQVRDVVGTRTGLYVLLIIATVLLGCAEVLRDNCGQTLMPSIVANDQLERANGRMWAIENVANTFIGPPVGSLLLMSAFAMPFFIDAGSFFAAAALVALIPGTFRAKHPDRDPDAPPSNWRHELAEGVRWLRHNRLLWAMAIILGLMNMANTLATAVFVLFSQEVLHVTPFTFTLMGFGFAIGGILGGYIAPWMSRTFGSGTCLALCLATEAITQLAVGFLSWWPVVGIVFAVGALLGSTWNVITVSLRQTIIPPHLLGRVNSVYRFFAWGMIPIGALLGGVVVSVVDSFASHTMALRSTWFVAAAISAGLFVAGRGLLTTERLEAARAAAPPHEVATG